MKNWLKIFFFIIIFFGISPYIFSSLYLPSVYENNLYSEIVQRQQTNSSIYGTALNPGYFFYKHELIKNRKPEVVILGSSRVLEFREESFLVPFVNAGGVMHHLSDGLTFLNKMFRYHKPKYIVLGLDFWWFNDNYPQSKYIQYPVNTGTQMSLNKILKPIYFLFSNKVNFSSLKYIFNNDYINNKITNYDSLGISAISSSDGWRRDGSYFYAKKTFGFSEILKEKAFEDTITRIKKGTRYFQYGSEISEERKKVFDQIIKTIKKNNVEPIILLTPLPNIVIQEMDDIRYQYVFKLREMIKKIKVVSFDYHDVSKLVPDDCEFLDGYHGGNVLFDRILLDINESSIAENFNSILNVEQIKKNINKFKGHILVKYNPKMYKFNEIDFLNLGCNKK